MNLIIHNLTQGSPEWHAHRRNYFNASDAGAMLGVSPYETRDQCLRRYKYGDTREVSPYVQRIFDQGHEFERLCRPLAEEQAGEDLMPVTGTRGKLSASLDGIDMDHSIVWEHKTWSQSLASAIEEVKQASLPVIGKSPDALPSLRIKLGGSVVITENNLIAYRDHVRQVLAESNTVPVTDQDFADADKQVKFCVQAESDIGVAIQQLLSDTGAVADAVKTMESLREEFRKHRLTRTKYIETRKDERNRELIADASKELDKLRAEAWAPVLAEWPLTSKPNFMHPVQFAPQIKGLKTIESKQNALMVFLRQIHTDTRDAAAEAMINVRAANAIGRPELWPDLDSLVTRDFEAFAAILQQRLSKASADEEMRKEAATKAVQMAHNIDATMSRGDKLQMAAELLEIAKEIDQVPTECADMFGFQSDAEKIRQGLQIEARSLVTELLDSLIRADVHDNTVTLGLSEFKALLDFYQLKLSDSKPF